jgi:hypothetical protein
MDRGSAPSGRQDTGFDEARAVGANPRLSEA